MSTRTGLDSGTVFHMAMWEAFESWTTEWGESDVIGSHNAMRVRTSVDMKT